MENSTHLMLAVGGVFLISWFGASRLRIEHKNLHRLRPVMAGVRRSTLVAFQGEFHRNPAETHFPGGAVICTQCGIEYPAGLAYCDCGSETVDADDFEDARFPLHPPDTQETVELKTDDLVCIHIADDFWQAAVLKSFLESHGVPCATGGNSQEGAYHFSITPLSEVRLYVQSHAATRARQLLMKCIRE